MPYAATVQLIDGSTQYIPYEPHHIPYQHTEIYSLDMKLVSESATSITIGSKVNKIYSSDIFNETPFPYLTSIDFGTGCPITLGGYALCRVSGVTTLGDRVNKVDGERVFSNYDSITASSGCGIFKIGLNHNYYDRANTSLSIVGNGYTKVSGIYYQNTTNTYRDVSITIGNGVISLIMRSLFTGKVRFPNGIYVPPSVKVFQYGLPASNAGYPTITGGDGIQFVRGSSFDVLGINHTLGNPAFIDAFAYGSSSISSLNISKALFIGDEAFEPNVWGRGTISSISFNKKIVGIGKYAFAGQQALTSIKCKALYISTRVFAGCTGITKAEFDVSDRQNEDSFISDYVLEYRNYSTSQYLPAALRTLIIKGYAKIYDVIGKSGNPGLPGLTINIVGNGHTVVGYPFEETTGSFGLPIGISKLTIGTGVTHVNLDVGYLIATTSYTKDYNTSIDFGVDVTNVKFRYDASSYDVTTTGDTVTFRAEEPPAVTGTYYLNRIGKIKVPAASVSTYQTQWPGFASKIIAI